MGWITNRHMKQGGSLNPNPQNNGSGNGPLRKVVEVIYIGVGGIFGRDKVLLECGHEGYSSGSGLRARCRQCKREATTE